MLPAVVAVLAEMRVQENIHATLHMDDATPSDGTGPPDNPTRSLFQTDSTGVKLTLPVSWALRSAAGVSWLQGANW